MQVGPVRIPSGGHCSMYATNSEDERTRKAIGGDELALTLLLLDDKHAIRGYLASKLPADLRGIIDADDLVQETHVEVYRRIRSFEPEGPDASARVLDVAAWHLLTNQHAELRDPARALPLARRAVDKAGGVDPGTLDTLALAQHLTGDTPAAIETEKKASSLLPPDAPGRGDYEAALAKFEAALKQADTAKEPGGG